MPETQPKQWQVDAWAASTRAQRRAMARPASAQQLDLFRTAPVPPFTRLWVRITARSINAELPARAREHRLVLAPIPLTDLDAYLRYGRRPDPSDPMMLVPKMVWDQLLSAIADPRNRPAAVSAGSQQRVLGRLGEVVDYINALVERADQDPIVRQIGTRTRALTLNNIQSWYPQPHSVLKRACSMAERMKLIRAARAELLMRLAQPVTRLLESQDERVVQFAGLVEYVSDHKRRKTFVRILNPFDQWQEVPGNFDLFRPLGTDFWFDVFLDHWLHQWAPPGADPRALQVLKNWLCTCLKREVGRTRLRPMLRDAMRRGFQRIGFTNPSVCRFAFLGLLKKRQHALLSADYNRCWGELETLERIEEETPRLLHLYLFARHRGALRSAVGVGGLKAMMGKRGASNRAWRLLCRHGLSIYRSVMEARAFPTSIGRIVAHLSLFAQIGDRCPPQGFQRALYESNIISDEDIRDLPPHFVRHAWAEYERHEAAGTEGFFLREEFLPALWWIRVEQPAFDKNQARAGWHYWSNTYTAWFDQQRNMAERETWDPFPELIDIEYGPFVAKPIRTSADLFDEGEAMHHCVADYHERCRSSDYLVFSIRQRANWNREATLGLRLEEDGWHIDELCSYANRPVRPPIRKFAIRVSDCVNAMLQAEWRQSCAA